MKAKRLSKARRVDIITTLPQAIIETILCLLPIEEAARTSILSREWRYKWTTIPKLVFHEDTVKGPSEGKRLSLIDWDGTYDLGRRCKLFYAIHQVLLLHQGPIHEFTLSMIADDAFFEIDQIILHLSRNHTVKKLKLSFFEYDWYKLPLCIFSLHHLTDLYLEYCDIDHKPIFNGLGSLRHLTLNRTLISTETLLHLLSSCPSLKSLCVMLESHMFGYGYRSIIDLFKCLAKIEHLTTWGYITTLIQDLVPGEFPPSLTHLKYFCIEKLGFGDGDGLTFLGVLLKCSPNLEKIKLEIETDDYYGWVEANNMEEKYSVILEKYSDVWLEHLSELEIVRYRNVKLELEFVKFILAKSPNLKKVIFRESWIYGSRKELKRLKTLLRPPGASLVEFVFV